MTTTMSAVWDRTVLVLRARGRRLAVIAALTLFVPMAVRAAARAYADPGSPVAIGLAGLIGLVAVAVWGQLALIAAAGERAVRRREAFAMAARRLPAAIGVALVVLAVVAILFVPVVVAMAHAGLDLRAMGAGADTSVTTPPGVAAFVGLYTFLFVIVALVVGTRLAVLNPVILFERRGLVAFAASFALTRGLFWRIFGTLLLYLVVLLVASSAARLVVGTFAALIVGAGATATFLSGLATALVTATLGAVAVVFVTQLYLALRGARAA